MAWYTVDKEVKELAKLTGRTEEQVTAKYGHNARIYDGEWEAGNRSTQNGIIMALNDAKAAQRKADTKKAFEAKLSSGAAVWRKVGYEWLVQVTGAEVTVGDIIEVERRNGEKSKQRVRNIISRGADGIYCQV